jgi:hypothetical protein
VVKIPRFGELQTASKLSSEMQTRTFDKNSKKEKHEKSSILRHERNPIKPEFT